MKLIICPECLDMVALRRWDKRCKCGLCHGRYTSRKRVQVSAASIILGMPSQLLFFHDGTDVTFAKPKGIEETEWRTAIERYRFPKENLLVLGELGGENLCTIRWGDR